MYCQGVSVLCVYQVLEGMLKCLPLTVSLDKFQVLGSMYLEAISCISVWDYFVFVIGKELFLPQ